MGRYDISKKRIYAVRQLIIKSVSARLNSSESKLMNYTNGKKSEPSTFPQQQQMNQKVSRELRQLGVLSEELPSKRNGRT